MLWLAQGVVVTESVPANAIVAGRSRSNTTHGKNRTTVDAKCSQEKESIHSSKEIISVIPGLSPDRLIRLMQEAVVRCEL